jgi:hypothetical protein
MRQVSMALAAACLLMNTVSAQTFGGITGEVKDSSGAIMPSVAITVTNSGTNAARSVVTNASGIYNFPDLVPGNYQIKVSAAGFQRAPFAFSKKTLVDRIAL